MKFCIERASDTYHSGDKSTQPYPDAYKENECWYVDIYNMDDLKSILAKEKIVLAKVKPNEWYAYDKEPSTDYSLVIYDDYIE